MSLASVMAHRRADPDGASGRQPSAVRAAASRAPLRRGFAAASASKAREA